MARYHRLSLEEREELSRMLAAGRGGSAGEIEPGLDGRDDLQDLILQRIQGVEVEGPVHL